MLCTGGAPADFLFSLPMRTLPCMPCAAARPCSCRAAALFGLNSCNPCCTSIPRRHLYPSLPLLRIFSACRAARCRLAHLMPTVPSYRTHYMLTLPQLGFAQCPNASHPPPPQQQVVTAGEAGFKLKAAAQRGRQRRRENRGLSPWRLAAGGAIPIGLQAAPRSSGAN